MLLPSSPLFLVLASVLASFSLPVGTVATEFRQLTAVNFESSIKEGVWSVALSCRPSPKLIDLIRFIEFFSPYCPHCKHFTPIWERLVAHVETQENPITLAQVNCITQQGCPYMMLQASYSQPVRFVCLFRDKVLSDIENIP